MTIGHIHSGTFEKFLSKQTCKRKLQLLPFSDCSWAGASWLFFRVARSTRMTQIWVLYRLSGSDRLEKQPTDLRQCTCYFGDRTLATRVRARCDRRTIRSSPSLTGHRWPEAFACRLRHRTGPAVRTHGRATSPALARPGRGGPSGKAAVKQVVSEFQ